MRKTLVLPIAGLLVIGGAGAVLAQSAGTPPSPGSLPAAGIIEAAATPSPSPATTPLKTDTVLSDVLDELVTKGTITRAQADAILKAVGDRRLEIRADRQAARQQLKDFLADGQITQEEIDQLPADSPLRTLTSLLDDGKITIDELRSLGQGLGKEFGRGFGHGGRFFGPNAPASPAPSSGTSG